MKFFIYDETMMNTKAKITTEKLSAMSDIVSQKAQYITAAGAATEPDYDRGRRLDCRRFFCIQNRINKPYNGKP